MSSKGTGAVTREQDQQSRLVPKLRFPEFRDAQAWRTVALKDVLRPTSREVAKPESSYTGLGLRSHGKGTFQRADQDPDKIAMDRLYVVHRDDLIVNITFAWEGAIAIANDSDHGLYVSHRFPTYEFKSGVSSPDFFRYVITDKAFVYRLGVISPGGAGRNRVMNKNDFLRISTLLPSVSEQQKIADCLSSIDALIAAEADKLEALKDHKKGLMQQLFPAPGETTPRLRFPEFRGAADWIVQPLGEIFDTASGGTPERKTKEYWGGDIPWITTSMVDSNIVVSADQFITTLGLKNSSAKLFPKNTVLIAMYGQGKTRGKAAMLGIEAATNQACAAILPKEGIDPNYVFLNLVSRYDELRMLSNSGGQENLSQGLVCALPFSYPENIAEQERISAFLSSIDALIDAQDDKIDTLKAHKQGLMQQLFPVADQVQA